MNFKNLGAFLEKNSKTKIWWMKMGVALILSNIFFFILFKSDPEAAVENKIDPGWVELQIRADLLTPYQNDKKVLLVNRSSRSQAEGVLKNSVDQEGKLTILIREEDASLLFKYESWEVLPYIKKLTFAPVLRGENYEIRY